MGATVAEYTTEALDGTGVFDVMMRAVKAHVVEEFTRGRIMGPEYATVYLGSLNSVMDRALQLLLEKDKHALELQLLQAQIDKTNAEKLKVDAEILLVNAQKCVADAQFDLIQQQIPKVTAETALLNQKTETEKAQTDATGLDPNSVIGKQTTLYQNQADGFIRDAEQKVAKLMADTWNVRRTTDEATIADATNQLSDTHVGRAVSVLLAGVNA